jgi:hypothetical protein
METPTYHTIHEWLQAINSMPIHGPEVLGYCNWPKVGSNLLDTLATTVQYERADDVIKRLASDRVRTVLEALQRLSKTRFKVQLTLLRRNDFAWVKVGKDNYDTSVTPLPQDDAVTVVQLVDECDRQPVLSIVCNANVSVGLGDISIGTHRCFYGWHTQWLRERCEGVCLSSAGYTGMPLPSHESFCFCYSEDMTRLFDRLANTRAILVNASATAALKTEVDRLTNGCGALMVASSSVPFQYGETQITHVEESKETIVSTSAPIPAAITDTLGGIDPMEGREVHLDGDPSRTWQIQTDGISKPDASGKCLIRFKAMLEIPLQETFQQTYYKDLAKALTITLRKRAEVVRPDDQKALTEFYRRKSASYQIDGFESAQLDAYNYELVGPFGHIQVSSASINHSLGYGTGSDPLVKEGLIIHCEDNGIRICVDLGQTLYRDLSRADGVKGAVKLTISGAMVLKPAYDTKYFLDLLMKAHRIMSTDAGALDTSNAPREFYNDLVDVLTVMDPARLFQLRQAS